MRGLTGILMACALLAACVPMEETRGHTYHGNLMQEVKPGEQTRQDVLNQFGSPSSVSGFEDSTWYYISTTTEKHAFMKPEIAQQNVVAIEFDESGKVGKVKRYTMKDGKRIDFAEDQTPTEGHSMGVLEQLLGNLGRFNSGPVDHSGR